MSLRVKQSETKQSQDIAITTFAIAAFVMTSDDIKYSVSLLGKEIEAK